MPKFLVKITAALTRAGYTVAAGTADFPATLPGRLVPLARRLHWFGFAVS